MKDLETVSRITREFIPQGDITSTAVAGLSFVGAGELEINFVALFSEGRQFRMHLRFAQSGDEADDEAKDFRRPERVAT